MLPNPSDVAALVRLPAVLSVPGDVLLGAAVAGPRPRRQTAAIVGSSALLYLGGMALNDWADRDVDAQERPGRPIPSGRVSPAFAFTLAAGLTVAGLGLAAAGGGGLGVALPLAGMVWAYDLILKQTSLGPAAMAACRTLDVLGGAAGSGASWRAVPVAGMVGTHISVVSGLSRREVSGGVAAHASAGLAVTGALAGVAVGMGVRGHRGRCPRCSRRVSALFGSAYACSFGWAQWRAARQPTPANVERAVGAGVLGLMPLEASLLAANGAVAPAALVGGAWPLARRLARRRAVT